MSYVEDDKDKAHEKEPKTWILKQLFICSTLWVQCFMGGLCVGAPTVFIPQIRKDVNSTVVIDEELGSWLYSTSGFATYPWIIILPLSSKYWGRKLSQLATSVCSVIIFVTLYFSQSPYHIIISEIFQGFLYAGNATIRVLTLIEYTSPKYRGLFLTVKCASFFWGLWVSNAIGTFLPWKYIAILGFICSIYSFNVLWWPESPYWLASRDRFEECKASYRWLHGRSVNSEKDLQDIITMSHDMTTSVKLSFIKMFKSMEFYKPLSICMLTVIQYNFSGKVVCALYILDIFKKITEDEKTAYTAMLILDGITVFGMYCGSLLSRILKRRTLYFSSSFTSIFLLFVISLYLYLGKLSILINNNNIVISLLTLYSLAVSSGPMIFGLAYFGEIIPSKFQSSCTIITGLIFAITYSWLIKLTPLLFSYFAIHGTFLFFGIICALCTIYLYTHMPETKDKTQLEIEQFFKNRRLVDEVRPLQRNN